MKLKTAMEVKLAYRAVCGGKNQVRNNEPGKQIKYKVLGQGRILNFSILTSPLPG